MKHKLLEAKATATDLGEFTAIAAAYSVDRGNERIVPGAFKSTIERWQGSEKMIPLHWDHSGEPDHIIGRVDPASMSETEHGLQVSGKLDLDESALAKEAWRSIKANSVGLSFGYLVTEGEQTDEVYEIKGIDLFEISITPSPMNPDTRFTDLKSISVALDGKRVTDGTAVHFDHTDADQEPADDKDVGDEEPAGRPTRKASEAEADQYELERLESFL